MEYQHVSKMGVPHNAVFERCEDEPIATPDAIQPHGILLVLDGAQERVSHVSANAQALLGAEAEALLAMSADELATLFKLEPQTLHAALHKAATLAALPDGRLAESPRLLQVSAPCGRDFSAQLIAYRGHLFVELEPLVPTPLDLGNVVAETMQRLRRAKDHEALFQAAVEAVHALTGFDRIAMYVFDRAWHGEVVAEVTQPGCLESLGLHFPSTDIPAQARALYARTACRGVVDVNYVPVPILCRSGSSDALDLSHCGLRSMSPIHREYLRNFSAHASLSMSIMLGPRLFGLISCNHEAGAKWVAPQVRAACVTIAEMVSGMLESEYAPPPDEAVQVLMPGLVRKMSRLVDVSRVLLGEPPNMLGIAQADGAALFYNGRVTSCGEVPPADGLMRLVNWLKDGRLEHGVFVTDTLPQVFAESEAWRACACGLLAVAACEEPFTLMLWFRGEIAKHVSWGGAGPAHAKDGAHSLRPRSSFARWQQAVHLHAQPFTEQEVACGRQLAREVEQSIVRQSLQLAHTNAALERSNRELDAFAHAASHDLKEPLRGVHNFVSMAQRDLAEGQATDTIASNLDTVHKLIDRMNTLIGALMHYAQVGSSQLRLRPTPLTALIEPLLGTLRDQPDDREVKVDVAPSLPVVLADRALLSEVFTNLFTNAIKYNKHHQVDIEVGCEPCETPGMVTLFVRDNGIGIAQQNHDDVFSIFRRLHARDAFGGGSGTGLTIAKRIVESHGGSMWLTSVPDEGSTFHFSLRHASSDA